MALSTTIKNVTLSITALNTVMVIVVMTSVIMLSDMAPSLIPLSIETIDI